MPVPGGRLRGFCRLARVTGCTVALVLVLGFAVRIGDVLSSSRGVPPEGWALLGAGVLLLGTSLRLGVRVDGNGLRVRSWLRTHRFDGLSVRSVQAVPYAGWVTWGGAYRIVFVLSVSTDGRRYDLNCTAAARRTAERRARRLAERLGTQVG